MTLRSAAVRHMTVAVIAALGLAACGTTVPLASQLQTTTGTTGTAQGQALGASDPAAAAVSGDASLGGGAVSAPAASAGAAAAGSSSGSGSGTGSATSGGQAVTTVGGAPVPAAGGAAATNRSPATTTGKTRTTSSGTTTTKSTKKTAASAAPKVTTSAAAAAGIPATGPGWDKANVYIGVVESTDTESTFASVGYSGIDPGNTEAQANAVAADLNSHGGVLGRQVKVLFDNVPLLQSATNPSTAGQAACTNFTQDHPVIMVFNEVDPIDTDTFRQCLANGKIPLFDASLEAVDDQIGASLAGFFEQSMAVSWTVLAPYLVNHLKAENYFTGWNAATGTASPATPVKVGIEVGGSPEGARIGVLLQNALKSAGITNSEIYNYGVASSGQSQAVLHFQTDGVTHVIMTDVQLAAFEISANGQSYKPRYGVSSYNAPLEDLEATAPAAQNVGAVGVGWAPALDVDVAHDPGSTGPGQANCLGVMTAAGQTFASDRLAQVYASAICDALYLTAKGAAAGGGFVPTQLDRGIFSVSSGFSSAEAFSTGLTASHAYVPGTARDLAWGTACSCFTYTSGATPLQ